VSAEEERDLLLQAIWDARTALGFDTDGDTKFHSTDYAAIAREHVREAQEVRRDHDEALDEGIEAERLLGEVRRLVAPQWRPVPMELVPDAPVMAFREGRNWMIDKIREVLGVPADDSVSLSHD
jgi:hypothetical protein